MSFRFAGTASGVQKAEGAGGGGLGIGYVLWHPVQQSTAVGQCKHTRERPNGPGERDYISPRPFECNGSGVLEIDRSEAAAGRRRRYETRVGQHPNHNVYGMWRHWSDEREAATPSQDL